MAALWRLPRRRGCRTGPIRSGLHELTGDEELDPRRQRKARAGRKSRADEQPTLITALEALVEPTSRGDPLSPLRWTCKSLVNLANELVQQGFAVSQTTVGQRLKQSGYSLQANRKTREGKDHPDREAQFLPINRRGAAYRRGGRPAISVDTKKKRAGWAIRKTAAESIVLRVKPVAVDTHDFPAIEGGERGALRRL